MKNKKKKMKTSNKLLVVSVIMIILFTIAAMVLQFLGNGIEIPSTLIICWYSFWTVEIFAMAGIKITKVKHGYASPEDILQNFIEEDEDNETEID